ncbi:hypothetical protein [Streptomyces sp. CT34]|uniref:hypothetical protein n=1 Tax=Streptomyces sp. CT34 TaxID=1553907 RepID=UPI0012FF2204|nr:hypothetical protein [Streptomyces sp. CT34]
MRHGKAKEGADGWFIGEAFALGGVGNDDVRRDPRGYRPAMTGMIDMSNITTERDVVRKASSETLEALYRVGNYLPRMLLEGEITPARAWVISHSVNRVLNRYGVPRPGWEEVVAASTPQ